ncbi:MAG: leader peptidase (prepilin peptidase) / N-methyltransferase, partial [Caballeronia mineralivorans]|nr:leader peptidase (prepilin peptidase) / N-methyltransferase [Caballeronia mineralivorans]
MQPLYQAEFSGRYFDAYGFAVSALPLAAQYGFAIVFGLVIGSFLTVVVHRLPIMLERAWQAE